MAWLKTNFPADQASHGPQTHLISALSIFVKPEVCVEDPEPTEQMKEIVKEATCR